MAWHLIRASLRRQKALYLVWLLSLSAAVAGLVVVDVFRGSLGETLRTQGRDMLTADVALSMRQKLPASVREGLAAALPPGSRFAEMTEMFGMVTDPESRESRLAALRAVSDDFPLVGALVIERDGTRARTARELAPGAVWVARDLLTLLGTRVGARLALGGRELTIAGVIAKDPSQTFRFGNVAPRVYLRRADLDATGLIQFGSTFSETLLAALPGPAPAGLKRDLEARFTDPGLSVSVPADLEQGALQVLRRLMDFLGLTGLVTLSLGWIGVYYLGRRWLTLEALSAGLLKCLGLSSAEVRRLLLAKLMIVVSLGVLLGGAGAWVAARGLFPFVRDSLPDEFTLVWSWGNTLLLLAIGPLAGWLLLYQPVARTAGEKPLALVQERGESAPDWRGVTVLIAAVSLLFVALTFLQARSWRVTGSFLGALGVSLVLIGALSLGVLSGVRRLNAALDRHWVTHLLRALWTRRLATSALLIGVSALAGLLSQLLPHLEKTLVGELARPSVAEGRLERPALFMVDIQDEQRAPLEEFLRREGLRPSYASPFIRARILAVNGRPFERGQVGRWSTREEETEARFRNRGVNLSYRREISPSERVVAGKAWERLSVDPPEISVEESYAERLGLRLGDRVRFDIQGVELEARIASLRAVEWDSFLPNFFIQFPDGVLNDAPKTWIMTVAPDPRRAPVELQSLIAREFPNVTSINVKETLDGVAELVRKLSGGLRTASRLALGLGVLVFLLILAFQLMSARRDAHQLRVLGLTSREIWWFQVLCYGGLCFLGTLIGAGLAVGVAWGLMRFAFDARVEFDWRGMLAVGAATLGAGLAGVAILGLREVRRASGWSHSEI